MDQPRLGSFVPRVSCHKLAFVIKYGGTPSSHPFIDGLSIVNPSILVGFPVKNQPFWGCPPGCGNPEEMPAVDTCLVVGPDPGPGCFSFEAPQNCWFMREDPVKMDENWRYSLESLKYSTCSSLIFQNCLFCDCVCPPHSGIVNLSNDDQFVGLLAQAV